MLNTQQLTATNQAHFQALMGLAAKAFDGVEQVTALNLQVVKTSLGEATETGRAVLSAQDPQALFALQAGLLQPAAEKAGAYGQQVYGIVAGVKAEVDKFVAEQTAAAQAAFVAALEAAGQNAPEGTGYGIELFKSAIATANNAFDGLQTAGHQATQAAQANVAAASRSAAKALGKARRG